MAVPCPLCGNDVNWVTAGTAAKLLDVSSQRIRQFITDGRFPNAVKFQRDDGGLPLWKLPVADVIALKKARDNA